MITAVSVRFCWLDNLPIDQSPAYRTLVEEHGKRKANRWTYWADVPLPKGVSP